LTKRVLSDINELRSLPDKAKPFVGRGEQKVADFA